MHICGFFRTFAAKILTCYLMKKILLMSAFVLCLIGCKSNDPADYGWLYVRNDHEKVLSMHIYGPEPDNTFTYDLYQPCGTDTTLRMHKGAYNFSLFFDNNLLYESFFVIHGQETFEMKY